MKKLLSLLSVLFLISWCYESFREYVIFEPNHIKDGKYLVELSKNLESLNVLGRQAFEKEITPSGGFYISKWAAFLEKKSFYTPKTLSFVVDEISGVEIDEPIDWHFAEFIFKNKLND